MTVPDSDSIIITQPHSSSYSDPDAPSASYHWLGACAAEKERVDPDELDPPFLVSKPTEDSPDSRPLRFWVSINVKRDRAEPAEVAQAGIHAKLRRHGGLIVSKRSQADVLVVNRETEFYRTVKKEIAAKGRHWQTTAEKEWVDACVAHRELLSATDVDLGLKQRSLSVESVTSEDDVRIGRGPGRPVGKCALCVASTELTSGLETSTPPKMTTSSAAFWPRTTRMARTARARRTKTW